MRNSQEKMMVPDEPKQDTRNTWKIVPSKQFDIQKTGISMESINTDQHDIHRLLSKTNNYNLKPVYGNVVTTKNKMIAKKNKQ